jgi:toxin CcdB
VLQFDVFPNPVAASRRAYPLMMCLQADLFADGTDKVVAPLALRRHLSGISSHIAPVVNIDDEEYLVMVNTLATLPVRLLSHRVANLSRHRDALLGAVDLLFYGV